MNNIPMYDVVRKLIGPIDPIGCSESDRLRYENLEILKNLAYNIIKDIYDVTSNAGSYEHSVSKIGKSAVEFFNEISDFQDVCDNQDEICQLEKDDVH